jgi:hypothetical protein
MASLVVLLMVGPVVIIVAGVLGLWLVHQLAPASPTLSRATFRCPFSRKEVSVEFRSAPGADHPDDVVSCTAFADPTGIRCKKGCLAMASTGSVASPLEPRFALVAGGTVYR